MLRSCLAILSLLILNACYTTTSSPVPNANLLAAAKINTALGLDYLTMGQTVRARQKLLLAETQAPESATVQIALGYYWLKMQEFNKAGVYYQKALALEPDAGEVQNNYGVYLCSIGRYNEALKHFRLAVQDEHYLHSAMAYNNAGYCALKIPKKKLAYYYFKKALQYQA